MNDHARLKWRCRRGVKELDIILTRYLETQFPEASQSEQQAFKDLLDHEDPHLFDLLLGSQTATTPAQDALLKKLRKSIQPRRAQ